MKPRSPPRCKPRPKPPPVHALMNSSCRSPSFPEALTSFARSSLVSRNSSNSAKKEAVAGLFTFRITTSVLLESQGTDPDLFLHDLFNADRRILCPCLPYVFRIDLKDPQLYDLFRIQVIEARSPKLVQILRRHLKDRVLHQMFKVVGSKAHVFDPANELRIDLKDPRLYQVFHRKIGESRRRHLSHKIAVDLKDPCFEQVIYTKSREVARPEVVRESHRDIEARRHNEHCF